MRKKTALRAKHNIWQALSLFVADVEGFSKGNIRVCISFWEGVSPGHLINDHVNACHCTQSINLRGLYFLCSDGVI